MTGVFYHKTRTNGKGFYVLYFTGRREQLLTGVFYQNREQIYGRGFLPQDEDKQQKFPSRGRGMMADVSYKTTQKRDRDFLQQYVDIMVKIFV